MLSVVEEAVMIMATVEWVESQIILLMKESDKAEAAKDFKRLEQIQAQVEALYLKIRREDLIMEEFIRRHKIKT